MASPAVAGSQGQDSAAPTSTQEHANEASPAILPRSSSSAPGQTSSAAGSSIPIELPDTEHPSTHPLHKDCFPYDAIMGTWYVIGSSLPLWEKKRNVTITYGPRPEASSKRGKLEFDDSVAFGDKPKEPKQAAASSWIQGIDRIDPKGRNGASFVWTGKGLLRFSTSHWQFLAYGYDEHGDQSETAEQRKARGPDWAVTYFTKTLFTPPGIDIYARDPHTLSQATYDAIISSLSNISPPRDADAHTKRAEELRQLGRKTFRIPHDRV